LQLSNANKQEQAIILLSSEEAANSKARSIAIASALKIELAEDNQRETPGTILLPSFDTSYNINYSDF